MKRLHTSRSLTLACSLGALSLICGCAGTSSIPDTLVSDEGSLPALQGSVYGGHAPLVGAHVYVLQVGAGAIGQLATPLLGSGSGTSPSLSTIYTNPATGGDPNIPAGWKYVITDGTGSFNISSGYTCTSGLPVYLYAYGGAPTYAGTAGNTAATFNTAVVNLATLGNCAVGGTFQGVIPFIFMNEVSTVATAYAFQGFTSPAHNDAIHIGYNGVNNATEGKTGIQNAAINTFHLYDITGSVQSTTNDGEGHIANYKSYVPGVGTGTGPNAGLGIVPQTVIDTLGNILAACVDSGNSASTPTVTCSTLFGIATGDGTTTNTSPGNIPTDTATAAINIARHPAGVGNPTFASSLYNIPTGIVPFTPKLTSAPPDFTVGIQYAAPSNSLFLGPQSVGVDAGGNIWFTTQPQTATTKGYLAELSPQGVLLHSTLNANYTPGNLAIDSNGNAWAGTLTGVQVSTLKFGPSTSYAATYYNTGFTHAAAAVADWSATSGAMYFGHGPTNTNGTNTNNQELTQVSASGADTDYNLTGSFGVGGYITHGAVDGAGYMWLTSDSVAGITKVTRTAVLQPNFPINSLSVAPCFAAGIMNPEQPAIDSAGNAWVPIYGVLFGGQGQGTGVLQIASSGSSCNFYPVGTGPYGAAVDGLSNVWITNRTDSTLSVLNHLTGATLSNKALQPVNQVGATTNYLLNDPMNIAVDISGDVIVTNFAGNSIVELIGAAPPLYGPLGIAAAGNKIGTTP